MRPSNSTTPQNAPAAPPDARLAFVVSAWPDLPEALKAAAYALIQSTARREP